MIEIPEPYKGMPFTMRPLVVFIMFSLAIFCEISWAIIASLEHNNWYFFIPALFFFVSIHEIYFMKISIKMINLKKDLADMKRSRQLYKRLYMTNAR